MTNDNLTNALYVLVFAGWFCFMCTVLRCCRCLNEGRVFEFEHEGDFSTISALHDAKPIVCVAGEPASFARVHSLGVSQPKDGEASAENDVQTDLPCVAGLERLQLPAVEPSLPSAVPVWSPMIALRTFMEPLTSRASAAAEQGASLLRLFTVSFFEEELRIEGGGEGVVAAGSSSAEDVAGGESRTGCPTTTASVDERLESQFSEQEAVVELTFGSRRGRGDVVPMAEEKHEASIEVETVEV